MTEAKLEAQEDLIERCAKALSDSVLAVSDDDFPSWVDNTEEARGLFRVHARAVLDAIASALATPASDGLPEGWKAVFARRDGGDAAAWCDQGDQQWRVCPNVPPIEFIPNWETVEVSVSSLSEACLAANERFPVVKPEAPAPKWKQDNQWCWQRSADRSLVHRMSDVVGLWGFIVSGKTLAAFPTAEEAMAWADRERPVA